jgi:hypothetical protein
MAPLLLPSGFKYRRFFSAGAPQHPPPQINVPPVAENEDAGESSSAAAEREEIRRKRREYERSHVYQDIWAAKLPWAESVLGGDRKVHQVHCLVCTKIDGRDKLLVLKLACVFILLRDGRPMADYSGMMDLMQFLHVPNCPLKHWAVSTGWDIAEYLHDSVLQQTREVIRSAKFVSVSCDEVTTQSRESWASFTAYIVVDWERRPVPLLVTRLYDGASSAMMLKTLLETLEQYGGLHGPEIAAKFVSFGADGVSVF